MKLVLMGLSLSFGMAQAAQLEFPHPLPALQVEATAAVHRARPQPSSARKVELGRRIFWLALALRRR